MTMTCSFCGKSGKQVRRLVAGPGNVTICNECVALCQEIDVQTLEPRSERPDILLASGRYFAFLDPRPDVIQIGDIAHALSKLCRFNGHVRGADAIYSVAQHCWLVSQLTPPEHALAGLLHDAAEAYLGDVVGPLKRLLPAYVAIERVVEQTICGRFDVPYPFHPAVKLADRTALALEQRDLRTPPAPGERPLADWRLLDGIEPPEGMRLDPWPPRHARETFLARFSELLAAAVPA